jgi:hypothetical protein
MRFLFSFILLFFAFAADISAQEGSCNLPAPTNLVRTSLTSTLVTYTFTPVPGAQGHYSILNDLTTGTSQNGYVTGNTFSRNVIPDHNYELELYALCEEENASNHSPNGVYDYFQPPIFLIIVDIQTNVTSSCEPSEFSKQRIVPNGQIISTASLFLNEQYQFAVDYRPTETGPVTTIKSDFMVDIEEVAKEATLFGALVPSPWTMAHQTQQGGLQSNFFVDYTKSGVNPAKFTVSFVNITEDYTMRFDPVAGIFSNFRVSTCKPTTFMEDRSTELAPAPAPATYPNPFHDHLSVQFTAAPTQSSTLQLVDMTGRLHRQVTVTADDLTTNNQYQLTTDDLPAGMYLLQVDHEGQPQQTFKVVKF